MFLSFDHPSVRLTGRWDTTDPRCAEATATGSYIEFAFTGTMALIHFDIENNYVPLLHLWIEVDGGARVESSIDRYIRVVAPTDGNHVCRVIFKGTSESPRRWCAPLQAKVSFLGVTVPAPAPLAEDTRKIMEFVGDSITEGVLIDADYYGDGKPAFEKMQYCRIYEDDVCATYAWLTAEALDFRPIFMGYGAVGVTREGNGGVPPAAQSYPYNFENSPLTRLVPDVIVINHGANDRPKSAEEYVARYEELLDVIRLHNPKARIVSLSAFCGAHHEALGALIAEYNKKNHADILFVDSTGWIPEEPLHPMRDGHRTVAEHLVPILQKWL